MDSNKFAINVTQITKEMIFPTIIVKIKFEGECKILCSKKAEKEFDCFLSSSVDEQNKEKKFHVQLKQLIENRIETTRQKLLSNYSLD